MELKYSNIREELIEILRAFADVSYQKRFWINNEQPIEGWSDDFNENVAFFGDIGLDSANPERIIGSVLLNEEELHAVQNTKRAIYNVLETVGKDDWIPVEAYIKFADWPFVLKTAKDAYSLLTGGDDPNGLFETIQRKYANR